MEKNKCYGWLLFIVFLISELAIIAFGGYVVIKLTKVDFNLTFYCIGIICAFVLLITIIICNTILLAWFIKSHCHKTVDEKIVEKILENENNKSDKRKGIE